MKPHLFKGCNRVIGAGQDEYVPIPAQSFKNDPTQVVLFCWKLSWLERLKILFTGKLWHSVMTFGRPFQPQLLLLSRPDFEQEVELIPDPDEPPPTEDHVETEIKETHP